ncbi:MAG TPA: carbon-nitrogen hydrolase family protein [Thermoleophilia bacterium]|nr:carbon-nitrogen hydrolase family protein [Thermoleophilia bacterium]
MKVACVQMNSGADKAANVAAAAQLVRRAAAEGARLVVLPETWTYKGGRGGLAAPAEAADGPANSMLAGLAAELGVSVLAGSIYEASERPDRFYNTSVLFDPSGTPLATYRKLHLFDAVAGAKVYRESDDLLAGDELVTAQVDGTTVGLTICYDLRFPELYRALALRGARVLLVPSAFTEATGRDHWEVLLRARAIENGCFVVAAGQWGVHAGDRLCHGRSMIVDPWGVVVAVAADGVGLCVADLDLGAVDRVRRQLPVLEHRRPALYRSWD